MAGDQPPAISTSHKPPSLPLDQCTLTPEGISTLTDHSVFHPFLRDLPVSRVRVAAITLITSGCSLDGKHQVRYSDLHDAHFAAHATSMATNWQDGLREEYMKLIMDLLPWQDRVSGGASFLVSTQPTWRPWMICSFTDIKMDPFISPILLREQSRTGIAFTHMAQQFPEEIGLVAMQRYDKAKPYDRNTATVAISPPPVDTQPPILPPDTTSHTFYSREPGVIERLFSKELAGMSASSEILFTTRRPLPAPPGPHALPFASSTPPAQCHDIATGDLHWVTEDMKDYMTQLEECDEEDEAAKRNIINEVANQLHTFFAVILDLERLVEDLELIKTTHLEEIEELRADFRGVLDVGQKQAPTHVKQALVDASTVLSPSASPSTQIIGEEVHAKPVSSHLRVETAYNSQLSVSPIAKSLSASIHEPGDNERCAAPSSLAPPLVSPPDCPSSRSFSTYPTSPSYVVSDMSKGAAPNLREIHGRHPADIFERRAAA